MFRHPAIKSQWLVWNLREDPADFLEFDAEMLADLFWTPSADLPEGLKRLPVKWIRTNRAPCFRRPPRWMPRLPSAPGSIWEWPNDMRKRLAAQPEFLERLAAVFSAARTGPALDPETALYDGFVPDGDRRTAEKVRRLSPDRAATLLDGLHGPFADERLSELLLHYAGRHAESSLNEAQQAGPGRITADGA